MVGLFVSVSEKMSQSTTSEAEKPASVAAAQFTQPVEFTLPKEAVPKGFYEGPRPKVFVPCCAYDWTQAVHYSASVLGMAAHSHAQFAFKWQMNDGIARARNNAAWDFLNHPEKPDICLFIDNDIEFGPKDVDRILAQMMAGNGLIIGGLYPKKQGSLNWVFSGIEGEQVNPETKLLKVAKAGTGFLCIHRKALEIMIERLVTKDPKTTILYRGDPDPDSVRYDFFPMHAQDEEYKSEDWFFCDRARECGINVFVDVTIQCQHVGKIVYPLSKTLSDSEVIDIVSQKYALNKQLISSFLAAAPRPPKFDAKGEATESLQKSQLWPDELVSNGIIHLDHCAAVLAGAYNLPLKQEGTKPVKIVDIGANIGAFARFAAKRWPGCEVHSYEPHPENFKILSQIAKSVTDAKVVPHFDGVMGGVKGEPAIAPLWHGFKSNADHSLHPTKFQSKSNTGCRFVSVRDLPKADIVKISVCGEEFNIIADLIKTGQMAEIDGLCVEIFDGARVDEAKDIMTKAGFTLAKETPSDAGRRYLSFVKTAKLPPQ